MGSFVFIESGIKGREPEEDEPRIINDLKWMTTVVNFLAFLPGL